MITLSKISFNKSDLSKLTFSSLKAASDERNYIKLVKIILRSLTKLDPINANVEQAAKIADQMQAFARQKLKELEKK